MVSAEWTGVIEVNQEELDCRLFSVSGKPKPFPLRKIHVQCKTLLEEPKKPEAEESEAEEKEIITVSGLIEVREQINCPRCNIALKTDEIGHAVETDAGLTPITDIELESLKFERKKRVRAEFINVNDPSIAAIGIGRRLYVFPKPGALLTYFNVFHILQESNTAGFIPELIIKKTAYPAIIHPLSMPEVVFGAPRKVLVVDVLRDSDTLKDPGNFPDFPKQIPPPDVSKLAQQIADAQSTAHPLDPERCVNLKRQRLKNILKEKMRKALR